MTRYREPRTMWVGGVAMSLLAAGGGCAGMDASSGPCDADGGGYCSAGVPDGSARDAEADADAADLTVYNRSAVPASPEAVAGVDNATEAPATDFEHNSCYDAIDNNNDEATDCGDPVCQVLPSCCVGSGDCFAALSPTPIAGVDFAGRDDGDVGQYGLPLATFGVASPIVENGVLIPQGDETGDSGIVLTGSVDLTTERIALKTSFQASEGCADACLEGAAIGVASQASLGDGTSVMSIASLVYSGAYDNGDGVERGRVRLFVGGTLVADLGAPNSQTWTLTLRPTGEVTAVGGTQTATATFVPVREARVIAYGRARSAQAEGLARAGLSRVGVDVGLCDVPSAWGTHEELVLRDYALVAYEPEIAAGPSVATGAPGTLMAFEVGGQIFVAERESGTDDTFTLVRSINTPAVAADESNPLRRAVRDPDLRWDALNSRWVLYFTQERTGTTGPIRSIGRAVAPPDALEFTLDASPLVEATTTLGATAVWDPSVAIGQDGTWVMVVRATLSTSGKTVLRVLRSNDGTSWDSVVGSNELEERTTPGGPRAISSYDEFAEPSLIVHNGAWQLYYAARRGARWEIGLLVSDDLRYWRVVQNDPVLLASGAGFDALGVRTPAAVSSGNSVRLYYLGMDGTREHIGWTSRAAASSATFPVQ